MDGRSFDQKTSDFLAWFKALPGATFHHDIAIQDLRSKGAGRGIVATADIPADTLLFTIPRANVICASTSELASKIPHIFSPEEHGHQHDHEHGHEHEHAHEHAHSQDGDHHDEAEDDDGETDHTDQDSWTSLILTLIYEHLRGANSPWKPYLDILPGHTGTGEFSTPMFWSEAELAELQASPVVSKIGRDEADKMIRAKILPVIRAHEDVFFPRNPSGGEQAATSPRPGDDELVSLAFRMGSAIMAYAFDLDKDEDHHDGADGRPGGQGQGEDDDDDEDDDDGWVEDREGRTMLGMVPMADTLNADAEFNAHIEHGEHALTANSLRPIRRGEEILNYYGPLGNGELLRRYGYVTRFHRRYDVVDLPWETVLAALKGEVPLAEQPEEQWGQVLARFDEHELEDSFVIDRGAPDPDETGHAAERLVPARVPEDLLEQLKAVMKAVKKVRPDAVPDKAARDRCIYAAIAKALEARTRQYDTTLGEDRKLYGDEVKAPGLDRQRMAVDVRIGEKELLQEAAASVQVKLASLSQEEGANDKHHHHHSKRRKI